MENSVEGAVPATLDELAGGAPLVIAEETYLPVVFDLLAQPGTELADVRTLATHPHAEAQVRRFLHETCPLSRCRSSPRPRPARKPPQLAVCDAAVAPPAAGELYGLATLAHDIADHRGAVTRFVLLTRAGTPPPASGNDRTTLVAYLRADHAGALLEILTEFASRGVNLTRIESRPTKERIGQYCFSIDCEGHITEERVGDALAALKRVCADVRYLGSYPRRDGALDAVPRGPNRRRFPPAPATGWRGFARRAAAAADRLCRAQR